MAESVKIVGSFLRPIRILSERQWKAPELERLSSTATVATLLMGEEVGEERIECVYERNKDKEVITATRKIHSYEKVAFDIYPIIQEKEL